MKIRSTKWELKVQDLIRSAVMTAIILLGASCTSTQQLPPEPTDTVADGTVPKPPV